MSAAASMRRGWCPGTLRPMETGDGLLMRLHLPGAEASPAQWLRIAALAETHGNGLVEISSRGNLQVRGLTEASHRRMVEALLAEGLVDEHGDDGPQRLTLTPPLRAEGAVIDAEAIAGAIERDGRTLPGLPPKTLVVIRDGGPLVLPIGAADIVIAAAVGHDVSLSERGRPPILLNQSAVAQETLSRLRAIAGGARTRAPALDHTDAPFSGIGHFALADGGHGAMAVLAYGRCDHALLAAIAAGSEALDVASLRPTPWRGFAVPCVDIGRATAWIAAMERLGLVVSESDPRLRISTCAGRPACARAEADTVADAAALTAMLAEPGFRALDIHLSGCAKACGAPSRPGLHLIGAAGGYRAHGRVEALAPRDLPAILAELRLPRRPMAGQGAPP